MKKMYNECQMVHADLSEYNMLWHEDTVHFIDVGQAVDRMHPHAHEFLLRDCKNVTTVSNREYLSKQICLSRVINVKFTPLC